VQHHAKEGAQLDDTNFQGSDADVHRVPVGFQLSFIDAKITNGYKD
jgi:hypothetical protein